MSNDAKKLISTRRNNRNMVKMNKIANRRRLLLFTNALPESFATASSEYSRRSRPKIDSRERTSNDKRLSASIRNNNYDDKIIKL